MIENTTTRLAPEELLGSEDWLDALSAQGVATRFYLYMPNTGPSGDYIYLRAPEGGMYDAIMAWSRTPRDLVTIPPDLSIEDTDQRAWEHWVRASTYFMQQVNAELAHEFGVTVDA